jgi:CheY-like chemotaxis protein
MTTAAAAAPASYVLVVDDDPDVREALVMALEAHGLRVESAANGREALERLRAGDSPCVILLDLMMPVMNGWRFRAEQASDPRLAHIPVVVLTGAGPAARATEAGLAASSVLSKPVDLERLMSIVERLC